MLVGVSPSVFNFEERIYIMAYVSQTDKKSLAPAIKAVLKKFNMKGTIAVRHHSTLVVNLKEGALDILGARKRAALADNNVDFSDKYDVERLNYVLESTHVDVNPYWIETGYDCSTVVDFLLQLKKAMEGPHFFNEDDIMTDYFHRSHYVDINVGNWDKPYVCTGEAQTFEPIKVQELAA